MSVIAVPTAAVKGAVAQLAAGRAPRPIVVITAGFKEVDEEGARLEREIADLCRSRGARLLGPNCLGLINTHHKMNASFASHMPRPGGISVLSQSGALCTAILDWAASRKMGLATLVSIGNKADLDETDFLAAFADDEKTKVIVGYLESIGSGDEFIRVAESVAAVKPVVILKAGTTSAGSKAASSHTGALAGADIAYGAAFKRAGVIRAETFEALFDYATALAMQPLPKGDRVAIITNAGGPGIMAADAVEHAGMKVASLHPDTADALREKLPAAASVGNPIDVLGDADPERYAMAVEAAQADPSVDAIIVILTPQAMTQPAETARAIAATANGREAGAGRLHGRRGRHARPRGTGGRQPARLPLARARRRRPQGHGRLRGLAAAPAAHRHPLPGQPAPGRAHHLPAAPHRPAVHRRGQGQGHPARLRLHRARRPPGRHRRGGHGGGAAHRLPAGHEDRLARHHPQVGHGRREAQPQQPPGRGRRLRADDAPHQPRHARRPPRGRLPRAAWCPRAARSSWA